MFENGRSWFVRIFDSEESRVVHASSASVWNLRLYHQAKRLLRFQHVLTIKGYTNSDIHVIVHISPKLEGIPMSNAVSISISKYIHTYIMCIWG